MDRGGQGFGTGQGLVKIAPESNKSANVMAAGALGLAPLPIFLLLLLLFLHYFSHFLRSKLKQHERGIHVCVFNRRLLPRELPDPRRAQMERESFSISLDRKIIST